MKKPRLLWKLSIIIKILKKNAIFLACLIAKLYFCDKIKKF